MFGRLSAPGVALLAVGVFLLVSLRHLDVVPRVYEDEPWQASTAFSLATKGVFGSQLFAGYHSMDQRYYGFMPLHPLLMAAIFKAAGEGLLQARLETVALTALTLGLTFLAAKRLFNSTAIGAIAVIVLVTLRWTGLTYAQLSGIPVVDFARIARYDPLVPVIGLLALHAYLSRGYAIAGALAGLAGLAHVYGLFWVPALALLAVLDHKPKRAGLIVVAAMLPWLPYALYVASDLADWRAQTAIYANRFDLLNPAFYVDNISQEYHRYGPGLGAPSAAWLLRPGVWAGLVGLPVALWSLARAAPTSPAARAVLVPALLFPVLFGVFIHLKLVNYTLIELPLFALALAYGLSVWWRHTRLRVILMAVAAAVLVEGGQALLALDRAADVTTPYARYIADVRALVPSGARVLGLHSYWFGMEDFDFRSFLVPMDLADEGLPLDQALDDVGPDVVLLDARIRDYYATAPEGPLFDAWLARHHAVLLGAVDDATYGQMQVLRVSR